MNFRKIVKWLIPVHLFAKIEPFGHLLEAIIVNIIFGFPARNLKVIGVTGTDGKTTTSTLIAHMMRENGYKVALSTTVACDYGDGKGLQMNPTGLTTPGAVQLVRQMKQIKKAGAEWLVLETGSHALAQHRVWGVPYWIAVITNMSHEHLDYHKTFERYRNAKVQLFRQCNRTRQGLQTGIVNADDPNAEYFINAISKPLTYGCGAGTIRAEEIKTNVAGSHFEVSIGDNATFPVNLQTPGAFNVYNALAAIATCYTLNVPEDKIQASIASFAGVPGRMESIVAGQKFAVFVDYAVTPEALKNVLLSVKSFGAHKIHLVFGATGDRDKTKRPIMGEVAGEHADYIYLTDDETYTEDPATIRDAVYKGIVAKNAQNKTQIFNDRRRAILSAFKQATAGDVVLLTGIGHQAYRNMGGHKESWDERDIARELLASIEK